MKSKKRYPLLDAARAAAVLNMVLYHFFYDVNIIFENNPNWYRKAPVIIWEFAICSVFIFISGVCSNFSTRALKRGIILNLWGLIITAVTLCFIPNEVVWFGILSFLGCAWIIITPLKKIKINPYIGIFFSILLFIITYDSLWNGYIGIGSIVFFKMPDFLYNNVFTIPLGFYSKDFYSSDFFPIFPWFFLYMLGYFVWRAVDEKIIGVNAANAVNEKDGGKIKKAERILYFDSALLSAVGRKSLLIYVLHQPICFFLAFVLNCIK